MKTVPGFEAAGFEVGVITMTGPGNPYQNRIGAAKFTAVSASYLQATGMSLLKGRWITDEDANVVLVNETFARSMFPGRDAIGRSIHVFRRTTDTAIVGVVSDLKRFALDQDMMPEVYLPYKRFPVLFNPLIALHTDGDVNAAASSMRILTYAIDRSSPIYDVMTLEQALSESIAPRRLNLFLFGTFATVALSLALTGIYGVISYSVTQRTHEIGVRLAVGAQRYEVVRMVVWQVLGTALCGMAGGIGIALLATRFMGSLLYDVTPNDPITFLAIAAVLAVTVLVACSGPALKAAHLDPLAALRYE